MKSVLWLVMIAVTPFMIRAETVEVSLSLPQLTLKNGRVYKPAVIKTYNPVTSRVVFLSGRQFLTVLAGELPDEILAKLKLRVPVPGPEELKAQPEKAKPQKPTQAGGAQILNGRPEATAPLTTAELRRLQQEQADYEKRYEAEREARLRQGVAQVAQDAVRARYLHGDQSGMNRIILTSELTLAEPEPVPGWEGRYRVTGSGSFRDEGSGDTRRRSFEVLVQTKAHAWPEVVDISLNDMGGSAAPESRLPSENPDLPHNPSA